MFQEYSARQLEDDAWPVRFTKQLDALVTPFRRCLLPACWDLLAKSLASALVARIERLVQVKFLSENQFATHVTNRLVISGKKMQCFGRSSVFEGYWSYVSGAHWFECSSPI